MKFFSYLLFVLLLGFGSCSEDDNADAFCRNGSCSYEYFKNSQINITVISQFGAFVEITGGSKQVFKRTYNYNDAPDIIDDELTEILVFELDKAKKSFSYSDENLAEANVLFGKLCYCPSGYNPVTSGTLEGKEISPGMWRIKANLQVENAVGPLTFDSIFN